MTIFWGKVLLRMPFGPYKSRVSEQRKCLEMVDIKGTRLLLAVSPAGRNFYAYADFDLNELADVGRTRLSCYYPNL